MKDRYKVEPSNQVLQHLRDTQGHPCAKRALEIVLDNDVTAVIGPPGAGKSTLVAQMVNHLEREGIPTETVAYDAVLAEHTQSTGSTKEGTEFNKRIVQSVLGALRRKRPEGKILFDDCGVGKKTHQDRAVTGTEDLAQHKVPEDTPEYKMGALGLVSSFTAQLHQAFLRMNILHMPPQDVVSTLSTKHNIRVVNIPPGMTTRDMGKLIQESINRMAKPYHVAQIAREELQLGFELISHEGMQQIHGIIVPPSVSRRDILPMQIQAAVMEHRLENLQIARDARLTAINPTQNAPITWYAESFIRQN